MNTRRRATGVVFLLLCGVAGLAGADAVWNEAMTWQQPGGEIIHVRVWGDEFYRIVESADGYTLVLDSATGNACYAELSADGTQLLSTGIVASERQHAKTGLTPHLRQDKATVHAQVMAARARQRLAKLNAAKSASAPAYLGTTRGLCLLIDFSDEPGTITPEEVNNLCNQEGYTGNGNNGSVRDFFYDVSNGLLTYTNYVSVAYHRASQPKTYYDDDSDTDNSKAKDLIIEVLQEMVDNGFDFTPYCNGDTVVDALNVFYAGSRGCAWSTGLWPHSGALFPPFTVGDITICNYQITNMGSTLGIGTFCHENGHMVCDWPDLYDYDYDSTGVGRFCLMGYGDFDLNPVEPCAYLKDIAGWVTTQVLPVGPADFSVTANPDAVYKYPHPSKANEYYLIENRQQTGRDALLPDSGLAIWHCDTQGDNDNNEQTEESHFKVTLVQADGAWDLENDRDSGDSTDFWKAPNYTLCGVNTIPDTSWWDGKPSFLRVSSISAAAADMTFHFRGVGGASVDSDGDGISDLNETRDLDKVTEGVQNPFDPENDDVMGNNGSLGADGTPDGDNDFDGDGATNETEFRTGSDPLDPTSGLPAGTPVSFAALAAGLALAGVFRLRHRYA